MTTFGRIQKFLVVTLILFGITSALRASEIAPIALTSSTSTVSLQNNFAWFMDSNRDLTIDEVVHQDNAGSFTSSAKKLIPYAYFKGSIWLRFDVTNNSDRSDWLLSSFSPLVENFAIYQQHADGAGFASIPPREKTRQPVAALDVPPHSTKRFYIRYAMYDPTQTSFFIADTNALHQLDMAELQFCSAVLGVFVAMIAYNLFLFASLRRSIYLWYTLFALANGYFALLTMNVPVGISTLFSFVEWGHYIRFIAPLATVLFTQQFLRTEEHFPRLHRALNVTLLVFAAVLILHYFTGVFWLTELIDPLMLMCVILPITAGVCSYRQGHKPAKFYLLAMGCFFGGIVILIISAMLNLPVNVLTSYSHVAGQAGEMLLMSMALASQIKTSDERRIRAEASAGAKSRLLRVLSHDIMNPLAAIKLLSYRMAKDPTQQPFGEKILRSVTTIEKMVRFIVKYESNRDQHALQLEVVSIAEVFDELAFLFQSVAEEKSLELKFDVQPHDLKIKAEKVCLTNEILSNLVNNAVKFSFSGGKIQVKAYEQNDRVRIIVKDEGTGIPQDVMPTLFDPSHLTAQKGTSGETGSGFGMPIVWSFVQELGGSIQIGDNPDKASNKLGHRGTVVQLDFKKATQASLQEANSPIEKTH